MTESEYVDAANRFVKEPPPTAEIFVRDNGEALIYDPATNRFAIRTPDGVPATFMEPKNGMAYWVKELDSAGGVRAPGTR